MTHSKVRNILVPTDFSSSAEAALRRAKTLAAATGAEVTLLHVVEPAFADGVHDIHRSYAPWAGDAASSDINAEAAAALHAVGSTEGITRLVLLQGDPSETIVDYARATDADLIVIGAHGGKAARPRRLGSVAKYVLHHAHVPVQLVRGSSSLAAGGRISHVPVPSSRERVFRGLDGGGRVEFGVSHRSRLEGTPA